MTEEQIKQNADVYANSIDRGRGFHRYLLIREAYIEGAHSRDEEIGRMNTTIRLYANQIEQLRNPWISVEKRLPEKAIGLYELEEDEQHKMVLLKTANEEPYIGFLDAEEKWRTFALQHGMPLPIDLLTLSKVTHWMPIPQTEKGE